MTRYRTCHLDSRLLEPLQRCIASPAVIEASRPYVTYDPTTDPDGFTLRCISRLTVVYSCGTIARGGSPERHLHPVGEIPRCRKLATHAARIMRTAEAGMGSEGTAHWSPFFVAAQVGMERSVCFNESSIRSYFDGCISPTVQIWVEPLEEEGDWWSRVLHECSDYESQTERDHYLAPWRSMIKWFNSQTAFCKTAFVMIGYDDDYPVFPRLAVGVTPLGSLAGIITHVTHT